MQPTTPTNLLSITDLQNLAPELQSYIAQYPAATISGMLAQATRQVLNICQVKGFDRQLMTDEGDAQISSDGNLEITIRQFPLQSPNDVVSVNLIKGGFSAALTLNDTNGAVLFQTPDPGWRFVFPNSYFYLTGTYLAGGSSQLLTLKGARVLYNITYWGGYTTIPDDLKAATLLMFRDIIKYTQNPFGATSWRQGQMGQTFATNSKGNSPLYDQAETILYNGGYVRVAQF
jgi:hypothetical protein